MMAAGISAEQLPYFGSLLDLIEDAVVGVDRDWRITMWNRGAERMYGWTSEEVLGQHVPRFVRMDLSDEQRAESRRQVAERGRWRGEATVERADGSSVSVEVINVAIRDEDGQITGYLGVHRDVTNRKQRREQLAYHASLLDNIDDAVVGTDPAFRLTVWNKGAERLYGYAAGEVLGRDAREVASYPGDRSRLELENELLQTGRTRTELTAYRKDGTPVEIELSTVAVRNREGVVIGDLGIHRDSSERRRAQMAVELRARQQALLADLTLRSLANDDLQGLMDDAVRLVARTLDLELSSIAEILPGGAQTSWRAAHGWTTQAIAEADPIPATAASLVGYTLAADSPVISNDVTADERFQLSAVFAAGNPVSAVAVVIPGENEHFGVLVAASRHRHPFCAEDVSFMQAVANVLGTAIERARVTERLEEVRESERRRIARELHDDALSHLGEALAQATLARYAASGEDAQQWSAQIAALQQVAQHLRGSVYNLRLGGDEDRPFVDLVTELVAIHAELVTDCQVQLRGRGALPAGALGMPGTEVLRIVGEALTNARRHSGARTISVDATGSSRTVLQMTVSDDGQWTDRRALGSRRRGTGITGMIERADLLGADLEIESPPIGGTLVSIELKLTDEAAR